MKDVLNGVVLSKLFVPASPKRLVSKAQAVRLGHVTKGILAPERGLLRIRTDNISDEI